MLQAHAESGLEIENPHHGPEAIQNEAAIESVTAADVEYTVRISYKMINAMNDFAGN